MDLTLEPVVGVAGYREVSLSEVLGLCRSFWAARMI